MKQKTKQTGFINIGGSGSRYYGPRNSSGGGGSSFYEIPSDRATIWQPGVTYNGGIPALSTIYTTINSTNNTTDRASTIQTALDACPANQVVLLGVGDFYLSTNLIIRSNNIVLRGTRTSTSVYTRLVNPNPPSTSGQGTGLYPAVTLSRAASLNLDGATTAFSASLSLSVDGAKGSYTVTVSSVSGLSVGDLVRLDELSGAGWQTDPRGGGDIWASSDFSVTYQCTNPPDGLGDFTGGTLPSWFAAYTVSDRPKCEMKKISSIDGTTKIVTFTTPLHSDYRTANTAKISKYNGTVITGSGIENISANGFNLGTFEFHLADSCWISGCEAINWFDKPFNFRAAFRCEIRRSIHHLTPYPSNSAENYGFIFNWASADCLIEDCIGFMANKVIAARSAGAGCVVGYCYLDAGTIGYTPSDNWVEVGANASHFVGSHKVLFEGNWSFNADSDFTHGNATYITHFRNYYQGFREAFADPLNGNTIYDDLNGNGAGATQHFNSVMRCAATQCFGYGHNYVGNLLGLSGHMSGWTLEGNDIFANKSVWMPGWAPTASRTTQDPNIKNSSFWGAILRQGNYDYLTTKQLWHGLGGSASSSDTTPPTVSTLHNSLYLSAKPAFFGSNTWPWVEPTTGTRSTLPAKARFDSGDYFS